MFRQVHSSVPDGILRLRAIRGACGAAFLALSITALCACADEPYSGGDGAQHIAARSFNPVPMDVSTAPAPSKDYRIGANDKLDITVFEVKDLSLEKAKVDSNGLILFPLIGEVRAAGKTSSELAKEIATRLGERYLANPHVSVLIDESAAQKVTVDGVVGQPGVYDIAGQTSLLQAVALAKGPGKDADLRHVAVFRYMEGRRMAAMFDLHAIRAGRAADPNIFPGDIVVVGGSSVRGAWRELLAALPAIGVFAWF